MNGQRHSFAGMKKIAAPAVPAPLFAPVPAPFFVLVFAFGLALAQLSLFANPLSANDGVERAASYRMAQTQSWVEEWDPVKRRWVRVAEDSDDAFDKQALPTHVTTIIDGEAVSQTRNAARYALPTPFNAPSRALAQYGPFVVASPTLARMVGPTNSMSPRHFDAMLRDFPGLARLEMVEAPGTSNDIANLAVGRKIRAAGLSTHVPDGGSVRSGAVELFLAGVSKSMDDGAEFAVHSWLDNHGREADDFAPDHPAHRLYLDYYVEMGMSAPQAERFYAMTNSVPHASALWLDAGQMRGWIAQSATGVCAICARIDANLSLAHAQIAGQPLKLPLKLPLTIPTSNREQGADTPSIGYGDLTQMKLAQMDKAGIGMSLLDS